jgi:TPR repeat protein
MNIFTRLLFLGVALTLLLIPSLASGESPDPLDEVMALYREGRYEEAVGLMRPLAQEGISDVQNALGVFYLNGRGTDQDTSEALHWSSPNRLRL